MAVESVLRADLREAMLGRDELRKSVIRMALAALQNARIVKGSPLDETEELDVLAREAKMRREAAEEYERLGKTDAARQHLEELRIVSGYLPEQLSPEEIRAIVTEAVVSTGASSPKDIGKVMTAVMPKVRGKADGRLVNEEVRKALSSEK